MVSMSMKSFEILSEPNGDVQDSLQSSDFIVFPNVPQGSLSGEVPDGLASASMHASVDLAVPDMTAAEMCQRLKNLLHENIDLKDKVQRNNKIMHEQLNTIAAWHSQIAQTNSRHRAMLEDLVKQNQKLQSEKEELEKKIADLEKTAAATADQRTCSDCDAWKEKFSGLEKQLSEAVAAKESTHEELMQQKKSLQDLEKTMQAISSELSQLQSNSKFLEEEKQELKMLNADLTLQLSKLKYQPEEHSSHATIITDDESDYAIIINEQLSPKKGDENSKLLSDTLAQCHEFQSSLAKAMQDLDEEKHKSENLANMLEEKGKDVERLQKECSESEVLNQEISAAFTVLSEEREKAASSAHELQALESRCSMLQSLLDNSKKELIDYQTVESCVSEKLRNELRFAEEELKKEQQEVSVYKKNLTATEQNFQQLLEKHDEVLKLLADREQEMKAQVSNIQAVETAMHREELDTLTAKLMDMEQHLQAEQEKVIELKNQVKTLTEESECIPVLKAQVEVYKEELEVERKARSDAEANDQLQVQKVQKLEEQIQSLQEMLQNRHQSVHRNHRGRSSWTPPFFYGAASGRHTRSRSSSEQEEPSAPAAAASNFTCPCCMLAFQDLQALENHVDACLDQNALYT